MCGILGLVGAYAHLEKENFKSALQLLTHRGPDDIGVFVEPEVLLGHRRLSILDLSKAGHQPMRDPITESVIVFNGEIYNYIEIEKELKLLGHKFVGQSDTEVLLHALIEWGVLALERLNGMWAFAFWSPQSKKLILARDRFGVKPLYFVKHKNNVAFASEPKSILSLFPELRKVNEEVLLDFLGNNRLHSSNNSFYKNIFSLLPSHYAMYDLEGGDLKITRYWDYPDEVNYALTPIEAIEQFAALFSDSVRLRMRSDVPVGITLSGGLDSTGVLNEASSFTERPLTCFTSVYEDATQGERYWAEIAANAVSSPLIPVVSTEEKWLETLRKITWHMDSPGYSPAVYPLWNLMKRSQEEGVPVLLEGQGADEALGGYPQYAVMDFISYLCGTSNLPRSLNIILSKFSGLNRTFTLRWVLTWIVRELSPTLLQLHRKRVGFQSIILPGVQIPEIHSPVQQSNDLVRNRLISDHSLNILPGLLHYGDSISMAHSIETRNPFLDYRLVEWIFTLPPNLLFNNNETKWVLREYLRNNGQQTIGNRPDKKGYPTPVGKWMATSQHAEVAMMLTVKDNPLLQWCSLNKIKELLKKNKQGVLASEHHLYKLLSTKLWFDECLGVRGHT